MNRAQQTIVKIDDMLGAWTHGHETPAAAYSAIKLLLESAAVATDDLAAENSQELLHSLSLTVDEMFFSIDGIELMQCAATAHAETQRLMHLLSDRRVAG
ncbi:MAG: hypothetical protein CVV11_19955 [Gammaproteobacteria bacterium HGW-Gammaproteobacteria-15]|nr:MAG: hypothetical protein CVV11_19955 [Gammaproteobacteria bacterium HGW-Gammaproteobacteria-15]